jgi:hypothetical protein
MIDPEEKDEKAQDENSEAAQEQSDNTKNSNWHKHQQIDEEGNEVGPDDI